MATNDDDIIGDERYDLMRCHQKANLFWYQQEIVPSTICYTIPVPDLVEAVYLYDCKKPKPQLYTLLCTVVQLLLLHD